jgi:hypothetical protein
MYHLNQYEISLIFLIFGIFGVAFSIEIEDLHILKFLKLKKIKILFKGSFYKIPRKLKITINRFSTAYDNSIIGKYGSILPPMRTDD